MACLLYSINLDRLPNSDEFYHILGARGILQSGEPVIGENGIYSRAFATTWLIAQSFDAFGESLTTARIPSVIAMILLTGVLFIWLHREAGGLAAWLGAGLFAVSPFALSVAQFARFYSLQGLCIVIASWLVFLQIETRSNVRRFCELAIALTLLAFAADLQPTTLFGILGLGAWAVPAVIVVWTRNQSAGQRWIWAGLLALLAIGIALGLALFSRGDLDALLARYRASMVFNQSHADEFLYYHLWFVLYYPLLWTGSGILAVLALARSPKITSLALSVFLIGFFLNSFAAQKNLRYFFYAQPFLFIVWGIGLAQLWRITRQARGVVWANLELAMRGTFGSHAPLAANTLIAAALLSAILVNPAWLRSVTMLADIAIPPQPPREDWELAERELRPFIDGAQVFVTGDEVPTLYYYGRADLMFNISKFAELPENRKVQFARDIRTDVPVIDDGESFALVVECTSSGVFVTPSKWWGENAYAPEITMRSEAFEEIVLSITKPVELPDESHLLAFAWQHEPDQAVPEHCNNLPGFWDERS